MTLLRRDDPFAGFGLIAEIGSLPDLEETLECALAAYTAGFDALKIQLFDWQQLITADAPGYGAKPGLQRDDFQGQCLDHESLVDLQAYCSEIGLILFASAWDEQSVDLCLALDMPLLKVGSGDITNELLLRYIGNCGTPVILSTGASYMWEIERAVEWLGDAQIALAACTLAYPTPACYACLNRVTAISAAFPGFQVGYSDHCQEPWIVGQAKKAGAAFVEAHWTVNPGSGGDSDFALHPGNADQMFDEPETEDHWGPLVVEPCEVELAARRNARRSLATRLPLCKGDRWQIHDLCALRPGTGVPPFEWPRVLGRAALRDYELGELLDPQESI